MPSSNQEDGFYFMEGTQENVFQYIKREETEFQTGIGVPIIDGWYFKMHEHIRITVLYKYGQLANRIKTENDPIINIILPILNVAYRLEDIDVKDIIPYVDDAENDYLSLMVKKYHDRWARREDFEMDDYLDELKENWHDFGLTLTKKGKGYPEAVPLQRLAFCDQTDIMSGPICEKHQFSPEQLTAMKGRWDADAIDEIIIMSREEKSQQQVAATKQKTPGKYIEVYELHGEFPKKWLDENDESEEYSRQIHIVVFYNNKEKNKEQGVVLYQGPESKNIYEALKRDRIYGRACGYGGVEELFEPQVWHNYSAIQKKEMLDVAAAMIVKTTDAGLAKRQRITDLEKGEMLELRDGTDASQLFLTPINWQVFDDWQEQMKIIAQTQGSANDPQLGVEPKTGTPYALQRLTTVQGMGIHEYRKKLFIAFIGRLYKKWFLKQMVDEMNKGDKWMDELTLNELKYVAEKTANKQTEERKKKLILEGRNITQIEMDNFKENFKEQFIAKGTKRAFEIIKDEIKNIPIRVKININDKQKNLIEEASKMLEFMKIIIANPALLENKGFADLMSQIIERYGLNPVDFSGIGQTQQQLSQNIIPQIPQKTAAPQLVPMM